MTEKLEIYKCEICGNIVQVLASAQGNLVCCGEEMKLQEIQYSENELGEKHTPKIKEYNAKKIVGVVGHPMIDEHYIQFIETYTEDKNELHLKFFYPNENPEMEISFMPENIKSIEYCNIHKLWGNNK